jgi:hypothetical protein
MEEMANPWCRRKDYSLACKEKHIHYQRSIVLLVHQAEGFSVSYKLDSSAKVLMALA